MLRDDLVSALMESPVNSEVKIKLAITPDYFEKMCCRGGVNARRECYVASIEIDKVTTCPGILIETVP